MNSFMNDYKLIFNYQYPLCPVKEWKDPFLTWNASLYDGIDTINVEPTLVWLPVIILYNKYVW